MTENQQQLEPADDGDGGDDGDDDKKRRCSSLIRDIV